VASQQCLAEYGAGGFRRALWCGVDTALGHALGGGGEERITGSRRARAYRRSRRRPGVPVAAPAGRRVRRYGSAWRDLVVRSLTSNSAAPGAPRPRRTNAPSGTHRRRAN